MMQTHTLLLTSAELQLVTALSGIRRALLFQPAEPADRTGQIQAVCRLIRDGFLLQNDRGLAASPSLLPFVRALGRADTVTAARPREAGVPSLCIYHDRADREFAVICPHENRADTFKLYLSDEAALIDELEAVRLLPAPHDREIVLRGAPDGPRGKDDLLVCFERYCLAAASCVDRLSIFRASPAWGIAICSPAGEELAYYHRDRFAGWLKGN